MPEGLTTSIGSSSQAPRLIPGATAYGMFLGGIDPNTSAFGRPPPGTFATGTAPQGFAQTYQAPTPPPPSSPVQGGFSPPPGPAPAPRPGQPGGVSPQQLLSMQVQQQAQDAGYAQQYQGIQGALGAVQGQLSLEQSALQRAFASQTAGQQAEHQQFSAEMAAQQAAYQQALQQAALASHATQQAPQQPRQIYSSLGASYQAAQNADYGYRNAEFNTY